MHKIFRYTEPSRRESPVWQTDRQTDIQSYDIIVCVWKYAVKPSFTTNVTAAVLMFLLPLYVTFRHNIVNPLALRAWRHLCTTSSQYWWSISSSERVKMWPTFRGILRSTLWLKNVCYYTYRLMIWKFRKFSHFAYVTAECKTHLYCWDKVTYLFSY